MNLSVDRRVAVGILTVNQPLLGAARSVCDDAFTNVMAFADFDDLRGAVESAAPDVILMDDEIAPTSPRQMMAIRRAIPTVQIVSVGVGNERRCATLLDWGADDAVLNGSPAWRARINAAVRRARTLQTEQLLMIGDIHINRDTREVRCGGEAVSLTPHEFAVLSCVLRHTPHPVSVDTLARKVWGSSADAGARDRVRVYVGYVRRKLGHSRRVELRCVRGRGYQFVLVPPAA